MCAHRGEEEHTWLPGVGCCSAGAPQAGAPQPGAPQPGVAPISCVRIEWMGRENGGEVANGGKARGWALGREGQRRGLTQAA